MVLKKSYHYLKKGGDRHQNFLKKRDIICYESDLLKNFMSNPVIHAFFFGRALAEVIGEKVEETFTNALSELGKFDAEQRENLRQFTTEVIARAEREIAKETVGSTTSAVSVNSDSPGDLQETIDELRANIARLRAELKAYRSSSE